MNENRERLIVSTNPVKLRIESNPYVIFLGRSFIPVVDVYDIRMKREYYLPIGAQSISLPMKNWFELEGQLVNIEFWINKESELRTSKYEVSLA
jgi:hypothetical protein